MAEVIKMPRLSDTMTDGVVAKWHKKVGDVVKEGDLLADIETDKATMEFEAFQEGVLLHIGVAETESAPVDSILAILGEKGEDVSNLLDSNNESEETPKKEEKNISSPANNSDNSSFETPKKSVDNLLIKASPLAKKIAKEKGIDISQIKGSGENGRIIKRDLNNFNTKTTEEKIVSTNDMTMQPLSQMRKTIASRLSQSKFTAPHFYLTSEVDVENLISLRQNINQTLDEKISFNDIIIKAVAFSLRKHPNINVSWSEDNIILNENINIGVAIAVDEGLLVPVIKNADKNSILDISNKIKDFAERSRNKKINLEELSGNTFTVSNLGMFGIDEFTAIINPPDACILAVGAIKQKPIVKNNEIAIGNIMKVTLSSDHRLVDGAEGAKFLKTLKTVLESPFLMI
ncbi:MAG: dihydrolipoamide acyltransferase [Flavobacteriales bacterium]|nr:dihydrolipoamide acyltransferase [Flavobacteriales bacterium]